MRHLFNILLVALIATFVTAGALCESALAQANPRDMVNALSESEVKALRDIITTVGQGRLLTTTQESQALILTRRLRLL
jgi:hypothetical protein